ncbi:MAG: T9SS type A sorting domain-containing protein, partial [Candidatus Cloacimonetes bacterium]|nr:T9SS type A sorting domain-containing protein [Candidatus Cloacimonadota bacterium]
LDFMIYSDYVLSSERKFVLFTPEMLADTLNVYGLYADDVTNASDHVPLVSDFRVIEPDMTSLYDIQHTTDPGPENTYPSLLAGQSVFTPGVVTAVGYGGQDNNFFISSPEGGFWEGIYVYYADESPAVGDMIELHGEVYEYYGMTEIKNASGSILSSGNPMPEPIVVNTGDLINSADAEAYEGCLVKVENVIVTQDPNANNEWYVDDGSGACQVDDGMFSYPAVVGDQFNFIIGMIDYSWSQYGINPRDIDDLQTYSVDDPVQDFTQYDSYPNPFSDQTVLCYTTKKFLNDPQLSIYNTLGQKITTVPGNEDKAGNIHTYSFTWNGTDHSGTQVPNGMYFFSINNSNSSDYGRLILLK